MTITPTDSVDIKLCKGLLAYLEDLDLVVYRPSQQYEAGSAEAAGFIGSWPAAPDRVLTLTPYAVADPPGDTQVTIGVQVRTRWAGGNVTAVANYDGAIYDALHGLAQVQLGGVSISQVLRRSSTSLGQDASTKRWSMVSNYYVDLDRPGPQN